MKSKQQLNEVTAAITALRQEINLAKIERNVAKERLDASGDIEIYRAKALLESAATELISLRKYMDSLTEKQQALLGDNGVQSIPFTAARAQEIAEITGVNVHSKPYPPFTLDESVNPSDDFLAQLRKNNRVWSLN